MGVYAFENNVRVNIDANFDLLNLVWNTFSRLHRNDAQRITSKQHLTCFEEIDDTQTVCVDERAIGFLVKLFRVDQLMR